MADDIDAFLDAPDAPAPADDIDSFLDSPVDTGPSMTPEKPSTYSFSMEGLRSFGLRTKLGFAEGPREKLDVLKANGIEATLVGNELHYLDPKTKKISVVDEAGFTLGDVADLIGEAPEFIGSAAGGTFGAIAGAKSGPGGVTGGGAMGSSTGAMLGKKVKVDIGRSLGTNVSSEEEFDRVSDAGVSGLLADPAGRAISRVIQKIAAPAAGKLVEGFKEANDLLGGFKDARGRPLHVSPAQGTSGRLVDTAENIAESSFFGAQPLLDLKASQQTALDGAVADIVKGIGRGSFSKEEYGAIVQDAILKKGAVFRTVEGRVWGEVDKAVARDQPAVNVAKVREWAMQQLSKTKQARDLAPSVAGMKGSAGVDILTDMASLPDNVSFTTAHEWVSQLAAKTRTGPNQVLNSKEIGLIKDVNRQLNVAVEEAGKTIKGKDAIQAYNVARNFTREWRDIFDNKLVATLANSEPQKVAQVLFKPNTMESIRSAKAAMGPAAFQKVKGAFVGNLFEPAGTLELSGSQIQKRIAQFDDATLREIFDKPGELKDVLTLARTIEMTQGGKSKSVPGGMAIQLAQPGAIIQLLGGGAYAAGFPKTAAAVVLGPIAIGKIMASPGGAKWLTEGFKVGAKTEAGARATSILIGMALRGEKGTAPKDFRIVDSQEAARLSASAAKAAKHSGSLANKRDGVPLTPEQDAALEQDYPGATRMSYDDLSRVESYVR